MNLALLHIGIDDDSRGIYKPYKLFSATSLPQSRLKSLGKFLTGEIISSLGCEKIDLSEFLSDKLNMDLKEDFRTKLFRKARKTMGTWAALSRYLCVHYNTVDQWKRGITFPKLATLYKIADVAEIPKNDLYENIAYITPWRKPNVIPFIRWLEFDEEIAEWVGLLNGDGCIPSKLCKVGFSNKEPKLLWFFMHVLKSRFRIPEHLFVIALRVPTSLKSDLKTVEKLKLEWSKKLNFPKDRAKIYPKYTLGVAADLVVRSGALARILTNLKGKVKEIVGNGLPRLKRAYLRGCYAAEGSVIMRNRYVTFVSKNMDEVSFVSQLLTSLQIEHSLYPSGGECWQIRISNRQNLIKFHEKVGFGVNKQRQKRLKKILGSYKYLPPDARIARIFNEISDNEALTADQLAKRLSLSRKWTWNFLHRLVQQGLLSVNKRSKPYQYSKVSLHDDVVDRN